VLRLPAWGIRRHIAILILPIQPARTSKGARIMPARKMAQIVPACGTRPVPFIRRPAGCTGPTPRGVERTSRWSQWVREDACGGGARRLPLSYKRPALSTKQELESRLDDARPVRIIVTVAFVALTIFTGEAAMAAPLPGNFARLIATADDLYARAAAVVGQTPRSAMRGALLANPAAAGGVFYTRERAFQNAVIALRPTGELESTRAQATVRLGQFDNFVHSAVADALATCNAAEARANLRVARELLEELHRVAKGKGRADWDPPGFDAALNAPSGNRCS
jgi:hypothetical protein